MNLVLDIPRGVIIPILSDWLSIEQACKLDSACCQSALRQSLLQLYGSNHLVFKRVQISSHAFLQWANNRKVQLSSIGLLGCFNKLEADTCQSVVYRTGEHAKSITIRDFKKDMSCILADIAYMCPNLLTLALENCNVNGSLRAVLMGCRHLKELRFTTCQNMGAHLLKLISLPNLLKITLNTCGNDQMLECIAEACPSLTYLCTTESKYITSVGLLQIAEKCTELEQLDITNQYITDEVILLYSQKCPKLRVIKLIHCTGLTNLSIRAIAANCKSLKQLILQKLLQLTDEALIAVANSSTLQLHGLHITDCCVTDTGILAIASKCSWLTEIGISGMFITADAIAAIAKGCPLLKIINISCARNISDAVLVAIAEHCAGLAELNMVHSAGFTSKGIFALADKCTQLKTLYADKDDTMITPLVREFWIRMRPNLVIL